MVTRIRSLKQLPQIVQVGEYTDVLLDVFNDDDTQQVYQLVKRQATQEKTGMNSVSLDTFEAVRRFTKSSKGIVARDRQQDNRVFLYTTCSPSSLCRSTHAVCSSGMYI